jgi:hypothetical protein
MHDMDLEGNRIRSRIATLTVWQIVKSLCRNFFATYSFLKFYGRKSLPESKNGIYGPFFQMWMDEREALFGKNRFIYSDLPVYSEVCPNNQLHLE